MNSESMPPELDVFISLLGEIDMLKAQVSVLDKNTHIALSQSDTSAILGNAECFRILKMIETLNANISGLNASLLNAAELVTKQCEIEGDEPSPQKKSSSLMEDIVAAREEKEKGEEEKQHDEGKVNKNKKENEVINNMLSYFKERFEGNE